MSNNKTYFESNGSLRQKAINLFYLIFLILIFSFIPSDFVDSAHHTNKSLDLISNEINQLNVNSVNYYLHLLRNDPDLLNSTRQQLQEIEYITKNTTEYIDSLKLDLINIDKMNPYGFFKNGRKEFTSNELMIYDLKADSLFNKLEAFKKTISEYLIPKEVEHIHSILPLPKYELNSEGDYIEANKFYFDKTPLNVSILNLSHFKSRVERIKVYAHQNLLKQVLVENATILPFDNLKIVEGESISDLYGSSSISEFFEKIDPGGYLKQEIQRSNFKKTRYFIESLTDTIHPMGKAIQYFAHFDTSGTKNMRITVSSDDGIQYFGLSKPGPFYFFPSSKGRYKFTFNNGTKTSTKNITVIDADPIIQNTRLSTLYIGLDNPLNIKTSEFDEDDNLIAEITDGQVIKKGEIFYARVFKRGITQVKIYADMPYGKIKVAEKSFVIRELHPPTPTINGLKSGAIIKEANLSQLESMSLITDEYLVDEDVYIADFDFMLIYNDFNSVNKPVKNVGSSFNNLILGAFKRAKKGDILIFSNIRTLSSRGVEIMIPSLTLTVV
ncbi:MAG: hypothetical protein KJP21_02785 [Bacteroidia bacterium]|nr:hypothetical protein [Bacteroidia bacterium]NNJ54694.1 hypothetical protein [Bacteroidia bacterium]